MIIDYKVIVSVLDFDEKVRKATIEEGWQPLGGIAVIDRVGGVIRFQAMVKYDNESVYGRN